MTPKAFIGLAIVTVLVAGGAALSVIDRYGVAQTSRSEELLFPDLVDKVNQVTALEVQNKDATLVMERRGDGWVMAGNHDYPVRQGKTRQAIIGLSQLRVVEAKTRKPDRFQRLQVEDLSAEDAQSILFRLKDSDGNSVAEVILGKRRYNLGGSEEQGVYLRRPGENQAWLARGRLTVDKSAKDWLERDIVDIRIKRARRITTIDAEGNTLVAEKQAPGDEHYGLLDMPTDVKLKERWQWDVDGLGSAMTTLELDDVVPASEKELAADQVVKAEVETFGGLIVKIAMVPDGEHTWATFSAEVNAEAKAEPEGEDEERIRTPEEVKKEVEEINARVNGWVYKLPDWKVKPLRLRLVDLKAKEENKDKSS